jgi:cyclic pyranopterin phosphate synthase
MSKLIDRFGRHHTYLRISVTDRCNLRCVYCMPAHGIALKPKDDMLRFEEIERLAKIFVALGVKKIRITGGEPLVRKDLEQLLSGLGQISGVETLALTTNAVLLFDKLDAIKAAGVTAINISLDSLRAERFKAITLRDDFQRVMSAIEKTVALGIPTIKLNVVVMAGTNDDEIIDFVEFVKDRPMNVRFIEYMPFPENHWSPSGVASYADMRAQIERTYELVPMPGQIGDVAKDFQIPGKPGTISFISSMTDSFCGTCNRLRLTSDGCLKTCLFYAPEMSLRDAMRGGADDQQLQQLILDTVLEKPEAHPPMEELATAANRSMVEIGG